MPFIHVKLSGERDAALAARVAQRVTALTQQILRKNPADTNVAVDFVPPDLWFIANMSLAEQHTRSFYLNISVTDETNTKDEKAAYIAAVYAAMNELLGGIHEKSYVLVANPSGAAYGYGGITQEERYVFGKPASIARRLRATA
jgi:4-oxalocrotonate tautomerase